MNVEIKQYEEDAKNYKEQISRLKQQVVDNERAHQEEMAARTSAYESEIKRLKTQLQVSFEVSSRYSPSFCQRSAWCMHMVLNSSAPGK